MDDELSYNINPEGQQFHEKILTSSNQSELTNPSDLHLRNLNSRNSHFNYQTPKSFNQRDQIPVLNRHSPLVIQQSDNPQLSQTSPHSANPPNQPLIEPHPTYKPTNLNTTTSNNTNLTHEASHLNINAQSILATPNQTNHQIHTTLNTLDDINQISKIDVQGYVEKHSLPLGSQTNLMNSTLNEETMGSDLNLDDFDQRQTKNRLKLTEIGGDLELSTIKEGDWGQTVPFHVNSGLEYPKLTLFQPRHSITRSQQSPFHRQRRKNHQTRYSTRLNFRLQGQLPERGYPRSHQPIHQLPRTPEKATAKKLIRYDRNPRKLRIQKPNSQPH